MIALIACLLIFDIGINIWAIRSRKKLSQENSGY